MLKKMASYYSDSESSTSTHDRYETEYSKLFKALADATLVQFAAMMADDAQRIKIKAAFLKAANHERELRRTRKEYLLLYEEETDLLNLNDELLKEKTAFEKSRTRSKSGGARKSALKTPPKATSATPPSSSPVKISPSKASKTPASSSKPATKKHGVINSTPIKKNQKVAPKEKSRQLLVSLEELLAIRTNVTDDEKAKFDETDKLKVRFRITPTEIAALQLIRPVKKLNRKPKGIKGLAVADEEIAEDEQNGEDEVDGEEIGAQLDEDADGEIRGETEVEAGLGIEGDADIEGGLAGNDDFVIDDSDDEMTDVDKF